MKKFFPCLSTLLLILSNKLVFASTVASSSQFVQMHSKYSYEMLDPTTHIGRKQRYLFHHKNELLNPKTLYLGGSVIGLANYQRSNRANKFSYTMRHPGATNQIGQEVSEISIHSVQLQASGNLLDWVSLYSELLYNPQQSFGSGTITNLSRNVVQVRRAYVLFGNKAHNPFYASFGKQDLPFGLLDTVNPFTASLAWHTFGPLAYSGIVGVDYEGLNVAACAVQGGAQFRTVETPINKTNTPSRINNFIADANYTFEFAKTTWQLGASFMKGSAYNEDFPAAHFKAGNTINPAWVVYGQLQYSNLTVNAEFGKTVKRWPATENPSPPLNVFKASRVQAFGVGGIYQFKEWLYHKDLGLSLEYSEFKAGPSAAPWNKQRQMVLGVHLKPSDSIKLFGEIIRIHGYTPLNAISGNSSDGAGTTVSEKGARTTVYLLGIQATL